MRPFTILIAIILLFAADYFQGRSIKANTAAIIHLMQTICLMQTKDGLTTVDKCDTIPKLNGN